MAKYNFCGHQIAVKTTKIVCVFQELSEQSILGFF